MSLRARLISGLLGLVVLAVAAICISSTWVIRSYLTSQDDSQLVSVYHLINSQGLNPLPPGEAFQLHGVLIAVQEPGTPLSPNQPGGGLPEYGGSGQAVPSLPAVSTSQVWAILNKGKPVTVPAQSGSDTWRVIVEPVSYLLPTASGSAEQVTGTLIIGANLGNINATIGSLATTVLIIGLIVVFILALVIVAVVRASLRPLVDIEATAGEIAAGHLNRRVPERDPRTEIGSLGRSLNIMLSQIETAFHAQEESEAAAHQSEERMRRFIADASHELRTPVTAIRGFAEYYRQRGGLVRHWDRPEEVGTNGSASNGSASNGSASNGSASNGSASNGSASNGSASNGTASNGTASNGTGTAEEGLTPTDLDRIMQRVEREAARMGLLVEDLLLLARLDQQRPLAQQPVDMLSLAADTVHDARLLAPNRAIDLSVQPGAAFLVVGDDARLRQVIGNLMNNALTHTPDGVPVQVSLSIGTLDPRSDDPTPAVVLDVTDQGPGMTQEQARRVFERFYRADQARTRAKGGSGLGLAIVAALVAAHGGVASVRTAEGKGTTFRITLPLAPEARGDHPYDDPDAADDLGVAGDSAAVSGSWAVDDSAAVGGSWGADGSGDSRGSGRAGGAGAADEVAHPAG